VEDVVEGLTPGLYLAHKAEGPDSYSVVERAKALCRPRPWPMCHGGALDPFASGLMLVLVGPATKLFPHLHALPKSYRATIRWGVETDNLDPLGKVVAEADPAPLRAEQIDAELKKLIGWSDQVPPRHSNKRVGGERAWRKAQRGEAFELPASRVYLHSAQVLEHRLPNETELTLTCRGGYYVRSLARDLGRALNVPAHLSKLSRPRIGPWEDVAGEPLAPVDPKQLLAWWPSRTLTDEEIGLLRKKQPIPVGALGPPGWEFPPGFPPVEGDVRGLHLGKLTFLLRRDGEVLRGAAVLGRGL
jgi:tRNA pseudouridine55 synthase